MRMDGSEPTPGTGVTTRADFGEWYNEVIERADLSDKRYPIKGMNVWKPYGWKAMRLIDKKSAPKKLEVAGLDKKQIADALQGVDLQVE